MFNLILIYNSCHFPKMGEKGFFSSKKLSATITAFSEPIWIFRRTPWSISMAKMWKPISPTMSTFVTAACRNQKTTSCNGYWRTASLTAARRTLTAAAAMCRSQTPAARPAKRTWMTPEAAASHRISMRVTSCQQNTDKEILQLSIIQLQSLLDSMMML